MKERVLALLTDLRGIIGVLFAVYGIMLSFWGFFGINEADLAKSGGLNVTMWTGIAMLVVGAAFCARAWRSPEIPPR